MSIVKRMMERDQDLYQLGLDLCVEVDALAQCEHHPGTYYEGDGGQDRLVEAYKLAAFRLKRGDIEIGGNLKQTDLTDKVKQAFEENHYAEGCVECGRHGL